VTATDKAGNTAVLPVTLNARFDKAGQAQDFWREQLKQQQNTIDSLRNLLRSKEPGTRPK
jgi:hypothetical protein